VIKFKGWPKYKFLVYNYIPRGDEQLIVGGWPAPPGIGTENYNRYIISTMVAKATSEEMSPKEAMIFSQFSSPDEGDDSEGF